MIAAIAEIPVFTFSIRRFTHVLRTLPALRTQQPLRHGNDRDHSAGV